MTVYNKEYYKRLRDGSSASAETVVPELVRTYRPASVLDLGCGIGTWLHAFRQNGVDRIVGFDGAYVRKSQLLISDSEFRVVDLAKDFPEPIRVDLAISLEVAEHLHESRADMFVEFLTKCSDIVLFGAAIPMQGGADHFNEQWQSYWVEKFKSRNYAVSTEVRDHFWTDSDVKVWYRQNTLLFVNRGSPAIDSITTYDGNSKVLDVVHPDLYLDKMRRYGFLERLLAFRTALALSIQSKLP